MVCVYVPFIVALMTSGQDVWHISLSGIGWQHDGLVWFVGFAVLTMPFVLFQTHFYARFNPRDKPLIVRPLVIGAAIMLLGMFFPDPFSGPSHVMHNVLDDAGSTVVMLAVTGVVVRYVISRGRARVAFAVGYAVFIVSVVTMLMSRGPIAMMEVLLGLGTMVVLFVAGTWTCGHHSQHHRSNHHQLTDVTAH